MLAVAKFHSPADNETVVTVTETATVTEAAETTEITTEITTEAVTNPVQTIPNKAPDTSATQSASTAAPSTTVPTTQPTTESTTQPTTESTTESTTAPTTAQKPQGTAELLNSSVLGPINSGSYTMTISAFGKDKSPDDKLIKTVSGGKTAFWFSVPAANMAFKIFPQDGKYYLATETMYCELTKEQYDTGCATFNRGMYNFSGLNYQKTETVREGLSFYTCEHFKTSDGTDCVLWYKNNQLQKLEVVIDGASQSLPMTVSSSVNQNYFTLSAELQESDYETLKAYMDLAQLFF